MGKTQNGVCFFSEMDSAVVMFMGSARKRGHSHLMESHFVISVVPN